ncbi:MAG: TIGR03617 family F420-dependent LLM class oxidoreductase [Ardenticatenales bacterium]|nr:TIGR03617 family F420-dependent LLM class oxidoreductase [Ardenticatenales bacterium]
MKIDTAVAVTRLSDVPAAARWAEEMGFDALWTSEIQHNPLFPVVLAAEHTERIALGTAIVVAFARSPMDLAYQAWDLAQLSEGRFILGLGTQVKPHIERRFSMPWGSPTPRLREYVQALRHIWHSWQTGEKLNFRGEFYTFTLMSPFFNPGPIATPNIPIYLAGVNEGLCHLAGEVADGFHIHPFHTVPYLRERILPWMEAGAKEAGRSLAEVDLSTSVFVVTGKDDAEVERAAPAVRQQIAFYASTPSYHSVMAQHGWEGVAEQLSQMAARQKWAEMPALISDEMLATFAVIAPYDRLAQAVRERYDGLINRVTYYTQFIPGTDDRFWQKTIQTFHAGDNHG